MNKNQKVVMAMCTLICFILSFTLITKAAEKEYEYDDSGRVTMVVYEDGSYETYQYDDNGNITQINYVDANEDGSEDGNTTGESGTAIEDSNTSTDGTETSTEDSMLTTESNSSQQEPNGSTSDTTDGVTTTGDKSPLVIIIAVMITILTGICLIIRKSTKEKR